MGSVGESRSHGRGRRQVVVRRRAGVEADTLAIG